jgi:hypothetical protein
MTIQVTNDSDAIALMANEFHAKGSQAVGFTSDEIMFDYTELENYLKRLTEKQRRLLIEDMPADRLVAFITFGDGYSKRLMGDCFDDFHGGDSIRPNSSFALFFKHNNQVELVFYTRFFVVSYFGLNDVRQLYRDWDRDPFSPQIEADIFEGMQKFGHIKWYFQSLDINDWKQPKQYALFLARVKLPTSNPHFATPWILLRESTGGGGWRIPSWFKGNTIHGIHNTKGCWMLLRNKLWDWPNENEGTKYARIQEEISKGMLRINTREQTIQAIFNILGYSPLDLTSWVNKQTNYSYNYLIRLFTGLRFDCSQSHVTYHPIPNSLIGSNSWCEEKNSQQMNSLFESTRYTLGLANHKHTMDGSRTKEPWAYLFLFKRTQGFTPDPGDQVPFS